MIALAASSLVTSSASSRRASRPHSLSLLRDEPARRPHARRVLRQRELGLSAGLAADRLEQVDQQLDVGVLGHVALDPLPDPGRRRRRRRPRPSCPGTRPGCRRAPRGRRGRAGPRSSTTTSGWWSAACWTAWAPSSRLRHHVEAAVEAQCVVDQSTHVRRRRRRGGPGSARPQPSDLRPPPVASAATRAGGGSSRMTRAGRPDRAVRRSRRRRGRGRAPGR